MTTVAGLDLPLLGSDRATSPTENRKLHRILASALGQKPSNDRKEIVSSLWNAEFFGLNKSSLFTKSTPIEQIQILQIANQGLLAESYFIEKAGIGYMAKMTLLAQSTEERMLYSLFGADEATHLSGLAPFVTAETIQATKDPFLKLLESLLEVAERSVLILIIQIVLEGWGLSHYRTLSKSCCHTELSYLLQSFLQAESRHHGAGIVLFDSATLTKANQATVIETLAAFLQMVQAGPQRLVEAVSSIKGGLSNHQRIQLFAELETETHSGTRLQVLRSLITPAAPNIAEALDAKNLFSPLPPAHCA